MRLILASRSPRRAELLRAAAIAFEARAADVDEQPLPGEEPARYVVRLASAKSRRVLEQLGEVIVLAADTAVVLDNAILGQPRDDREAREMLSRLSGRTHDVLTGVSVRTGDGEARHLERTAVTFEPLSEEDIAWYVSTGEGRDKAGAYAIQGRAARFVRLIEGSYTNVVGLPIVAVSDILTRYSSQKSL